MTLRLRTYTALFLVVAAFGAASTDVHAAKKDNAVDCPDANRSPLRKGDVGKDLNVVGNCTVEGGDYKYGAVTIVDDGTLTFSNAKIDFTAKSFIIQKGGALLAGSDADPIGKGAIGNKVVIRLAGARPAVPMDHSSHSDDCSMVDKGIGVMDGGTLRLVGARGVPGRGGVSWTHLSQPAGPALYESEKEAEKVVKDGLLGRRIVVAKDVAAGPNAWQPDDWIVVATTSFSPFESEFVQIERMDPDGGTGTVITLKTALKHYHFGGPDPGPAVDPSQPYGAGTASASFKAGKELNYGVDERAEVGLITRNIQLTSTTVDAYTSPKDAGRNWGGEMKVCKGFAEAVIEGVEIEKFGKEALGSYPIHFHMVGAFTGKQRVNANSVHHSYNKCVTIHSSTNLAFENNVCARITGHGFYQEIGDEVGTRLVGNLVVGVMNNNFGLPAGSNPESTTGWWEGDNLARSLGYTGLDIRNHDGQLNPVHGSCYLADANNGLLYAKRNPKPNEQPAKPCDQTNAANPEYYFEPPTGFWIINPSAVLEGNSIAGCQGLGRGYWYLPPANYQPPAVSGPLPPAIQYTYKFQQVGRFRNNRVHGCYDGIFGEPEEPVESSDQLFPKVAGNPDGYNLIARFEGFTASRIRNRAIWMRPMWFAFENARIATSREGVSLVTSGGLDGNAPGAWGLLKHAVVVALSTNNVDRWGPCANKAGNAQEFPGCVDRNPNAKDLYIKGYPSPAWNFAGFYIYDGPVRIHDTRFVRFRRSLLLPTPLLTNPDQTVLAGFNNYYGVYKTYEGDAALGWFQNNQSAYPTATEVLRLTFEETDLRHQVFTEKVNFGNFDDGDKNTAVIDRDGSLTGFRVLDKDGNLNTGHHPISLNNLPFNAYANAVDECHAEGAQDSLAEGRATSLISPGNMATLEFGALAGPDGLTRGVNDPKTGYHLTQFMTFTKDSVDYPSTGEHQSMTLHSRNNLAIWEPKVTSGLGYTATVSNSSAKYPSVTRDPLGIPRFINVGLTDAVKPDMDKDPFFVRLGVCYTNKDKSHPQTPKFKIHRGYKSWGGNGTTYDDPLMRKYFNKLNNLWDGQTCDNLDYQVVDNTRRNDLGCPADGVVIQPDSRTCPPGSVPGGKRDARNEDVCIFETQTLAEEQDFAKLAKADGTPVDPPKYYYDATTGMLYFYVMQKEKNMQGSSPIGSCVNGSDSACPDPSESLFACPAQGCITYTVEIDDPSYDPGASFCAGSASPGEIYKVQNGKYVLPEPAKTNKLVYAPPYPPGITEKSLVQYDAMTTPQGFLHRVAKTSPTCTGTP